MVWAEVSAAAGEGNIAPIAYGDGWQGHPLIGSPPGFVAHLAGDPAEGSIFGTPWQAVIGARVPLVLGDQVTPAHGIGPEPDMDHDEARITVTGRMRPTGSPWDDAIILPVEGVWLTHVFGNGHSDVESLQIGPPFDPQVFPGTPAILVTTPDLAAAYGLRAQFSTGRTMAFFLGAVLSRLHGLMGNMRVVMSVMSLETQVLVAAAVMAGLIVLSRRFAGRLALLAALGAPARAIFALVWSYAALLLGAGSLLGLAVGMLAVRLLSAVLSARTGLLLQPVLGWPELHLVAACFTLALLIAMVPAALALTRPLAQELRR